MNEEARRKNKLAAGRFSDRSAIVINVGAGSLLPHDPARDVMATRRALLAIRDTARAKAEAIRKSESNDS